jgi:hypothetical protein
MTNTPILIIAHRRPHYLKLVLDSVLSASPPRLYVSIDGARMQVEGEVELVNACRALVAQFQITSNFEVKTSFKDVNLGSAANVIKSVDWFFENENSGLILEEDCQPDPSITDYMRYNLDRFEHDKRVWIISGYRPEITGLTDEPCFVHLPMNWGWGTWAPKWQEMRKGILESRLREPIHVLPFTSARNVFWSIGARRAVNGLVDAWDTPLAHAMCKLDKLAYLPPKNLISNIGTDKFALNTSQVSVFLESKSFPWKSDENMEHSYSFQETRIKKDDRLIEEQMIKIRWKHRFLPIVKYLLQKFLFKKSGRGNLAVRV